MPAEMIVTERCRGLYRTAAGTVAGCEHPVSHLPDECGPDSIARPYKEPSAPQAPATTTHMQRMLDYVASRNSVNNPRGQGWAIHTTPAATLMAFAALADQHQGAVRAEEVADVLGNASSTVARHLRECPLVESAGRGSFRFVTPTI
jgi:hypothetical protein